MAKDKILKSISIDTKILATADEADPEATAEEFERHVKALRKLGYNVNGQTATSTVASRHPETGELIPAEGYILHAQDV